MNRRYLLTSLKVSLLAVLIAAIGASQAHAVDRIYPGSECVPRPLPGKPAPVPFYRSGAIGNRSPTEVLDVYCPVINNTAKIRVGWVRAIDRNDLPDPKFDVKCTLHSTYFSAGPDEPVENSLSMESMSTSKSSLAVYHLKFPSVAQGNGISHFYYSCHIPPTNLKGEISYITSYEATDG
jgi:hypothetical protein